VTPTGTACEQGVSYHAVNMLEQRIQQQYFEAADLVTQSADALSRPIAQAANALVACITGGGKVLVAGGGSAAALAPYAAALWAGRFERKRPALTAIALGTNASLAALLGDIGEPTQALAKEVHALGAPGDVLVAIAAGRANSVLIAALQAALTKEMTVIALTGVDTGVIELMGETDVHIAVPHERAARVFESHALVLHCLADAVDLQLMGEQDSA
jgi:D-sedoheptulose 7-phosphate isomerase